MSKTKSSKFEQEIGMKHKNQQTNDSFKRMIDSFYRSYSKISEEHFLKKVSMNLDLSATGE